MKKPQISGVIPSFYIELKEFSVKNGCMVFNAETIPLESVPILKKAFNQGRLAIAVLPEIKKSKKK